MNFKDTLVRILYLFFTVGIIVGVTLIAMTYLFVTDKTFQKYKSSNDLQRTFQNMEIHTWKKETQLWTTNTAEFLKILDLEVQTNKIQIKKNNEWVIFMLRKSDANTKELIRLLKHTKFTPTWIPLKVKKESTDTMPIESRVPKVLWQKMGD